jgi:hypothetical protein
MSLKIFKGLLINIIILFMRGDWNDKNFIKEYQKEYHKKRREENVEEVREYERKTKNQYRAYKRSMGGLENISMSIFL